MNPDKDLDLESYQRSIDKITLFHLQVQSLLGCARSPRMRVLFADTTAEVVPVSNVAYPDPLTLPPSLAEWETLCRQILNDHGVHATSWFNLASVPLIPKDSHCECALIAFIHNNPHYSSLFSYISVSKPSCKPCYYWISAYNQESNRSKYYTQGYHDKWYPRWRSPSLARDLMKGSRRRYFKISATSY